VNAIHAPDDRHWRRFLVSSGVMLVETAIWYPFWYELDQSIAVGEVAELDFFKEPPANVVSDGLRVFYHGDWSERCRQLFDRQTKRVLRIRHPQLGMIQAIDAKGLDYKFTMLDGRVLMVEAEETPGVVYEHRAPMDDWRIFVEMESA
jgi:hypothetical protein